MLYIVFTYIKYKFLLALGKNVYPARCACLGLDAISNISVINRQKFRIDSTFKKNFINSIKLILISYLYIDKKYRKLIVQQAINLWPFAIKKSKFFIMDTYSELTDKKFKIFNNEFFCHYSDFKEKNNFSVNNSNFEKENLLLDSYTNFFRYIRSFNKDIHIIIIIFPVKFDEREFYKRRYNDILKALTSISIDNMTIIYIPDQYIHKSHGDDFPYHFSEKTIFYLKDKIYSIINEKN